MTTALLYQTRMWLWVPKTRLEINIFGLISSKWDMIQNELINVHINIKHNLRNTWNFKFYSSILGLSRFSVHFRLFRNIDVKRTTVFLLKF